MFNPKQNILDQQLAESGVELHIFGTIADVFTGGAYSANKTKKKNADKQNKYNKKQYKFEEKELENKYNYAVESLKIQQQNDANNIAFQEASRQQQWNYGMAIRDYQHSQNLRAYAKSLEQTVGQLGFNQIASQFANLQQDRYLMEKQIDLQFDKQETLLKYATASHGLALKKRKGKSDTLEGVRQLGISALKGKGEATARGQAGRTAAKEMNAIMMEADAKEANLINTLLFDTAQVDMDLLALNQQNLQDELALKLSANNLLAADKFSRAKILMDRAQADLNAIGNLMLKPEIAPPLPKPLALPKPVYQDVYKPKMGPMAPSVIPHQTNLGASLINTGLQVASFVGTGTAGFSQPFSFKTAFGG